MALDKILNHPPQDKSANVTLVDIPVNKNNIPKSWWDLLPVWNVMTNKLSNCYVCGIMTIKDVEDDEELYLDYYETFELEKNKQPDWLHLP